MLPCSERKINVSPLQSDMIVINTLIEHRGDSVSTCSDMGITMWIIPLSLQSVLEGKFYYHPHFTDGKGYIACKRLLRWTVSQDPSQWPDPKGLLEGKKEREKEEAREPQPFTTRPSAFRQLTDRQTDT